jgi:hypothetical protein
MISRYVAVAAAALLATTAAANAVDHRWHVVGHYRGTCRGHPNGSTWTERDRRGRLSEHKCILETDPLPGHRHRHHRK